MASDARETFVSISGRIYGGVGLIVGVGLIALPLVRPSASWDAVTFGILVTVLSWTTMLRPVVRVVDGDVALRGSVATVVIPLTAVERVAVRQVLAVFVADRKYTSAAVGRSRREILREQVVGTDDGATDLPYGLHVERRLTLLATAARAAAGVELGAPEQAALAADVRRRWAWPEIVALVASAAAVVLSLTL